jgi:hypothetical protein
MTEVPAGTWTQGHGGGDALGDLGGQGGEHRDVPEQGQLGGVGRGGDLGPGQAAPDTVRTTPTRRER